MSHYLEDEDLLARVHDAGDKSVLVPTYIKYDAVANETGPGKTRFHVGPRLPGNGLAVDMGIPRSQRPRGISMPGQLPESYESRLRDYSHSPASHIFGFPPRF